MESDEELFVPFMSFRDTFNSYKRVHLMAAKDAVRLSYTIDVAKDSFLFSDLEPFEGVDLYGGHHSGTILMIFFGHKHCPGTTSSFLIED